MGFWGGYVVHRGEALVWDLLPEVPELRDGDLEHDQVSGDWQVTRIRASSGDLPTRSSPTCGTRPGRRCWPPTSAAPDLLWRFGDHPLVLSCGCRDEMELRPVTAPPDQRSAYAPAAAFATARLTAAAPLFGKYAPQAEGIVLRFGEQDLVVRATGGAWVTTLDDTLHRGNWLS